MIPHLCSSYRVRLVGGLMILVLIGACEQAEPPDVDNQAQREATSARATALDEAIRAHHSDTAQPIQQARQRIEQAIDDAESVSQSSLDIISP